MSEIQLYSEVNPGLNSMTCTYLKHVFNIACQHYKLDQNELLTKSGLTAQMLDSDEPIAAFFCFNLLINLQKITQDEQLGLHIGRHMELNAFHTLGYTLMHCQTAQAVIERLLRFEKLALEISLTKYREENGKAILTWKSPYEGTEARYIREMLITGWVTISLRMMPQEFSFSEVFFTHTAPKDIETYQQTYKCPVTFSAQETGVAFDLKFLNTRLSSTDPQLGKVMDQYAEIMILSLNKESGLLSEVRKKIYEAMPSEQFAIRDIAEKLNTSEKTLQRKLKQANVSFNSLVDDVRQILSLIYLEDSNISQLDIALLLGYSEQTTFCRAFKRWVGETPGEYRKSLSIDGNSESKYLAHIENMIKK